MTTHHNPPPSPFSPPHQTERLEWQQFQCDLQVAVSVADRLRVEAEQALASLQENHSALEIRLAQALAAQRETNSELESLRVEHQNVSGNLAALTAQQQEERAELSALRNLVKEIADCDQQAERRSPEHGEGTQQVAEERSEGNETDGDELGKDLLAAQGEDAPDEDHCPDTANKVDSTQLTGKGVAEEYLRCLAAEEKKRERQKDPRKIVMLSERSWWVDVCFFFFSNTNQPHWVKEQHLQNHAFQESFSAPDQPIEGKRILEKKQLNIAAVQGLFLEFKSDTKRNAFR